MYGGSLKGGKNQRLLMNSVFSAPSKKRTKGDINSVFKGKVHVKNFLKVLGIQNLTVLIQSDVGWEMH